MQRGKDLTEVSFLAAQPKFKADRGCKRKWAEGGDGLEQQEHGGLSDAEEAAEGQHPEGAHDRLSDAKEAAECQHPEGGRCRHYCRHGPHGAC